MHETRKHKLNHINDWLIHFYLVTFSYFCFVCKRCFNFLYFKLFSLSINKNTVIFIFVS